MKYNKFSDLEKDIMGLLEQEDYKEALNVIEEAYKKLPSNEMENNYFDIMYLQAFSCTKLEDYDKCFNTIEEVIEKGYAFPLEFDRYKPLSKLDGYKELSSKNKMLLSQLKSKAKLKYEIHLPSNYNPEKEYPLFIALHGDGIANIEEFSQDWKPDVFIQSDFIFVYAQSSQVICYNGYGWLNDPELARRDIKECFEVVSEKYSIDKDNILIGGYSGGAIASIDFVMSNTLPVKGFISLCPEIRPESFTKKNVILATRNGVKGVIMEGELVLPIDSETEMMEIFDEVEFPYEYYINKGVGHIPPTDFNEKLDRALKFILD